MAKRYVRKKDRKGTRLGVWALLTAVAILAVGLVIGLSSCKKEAVPQDSDALWDGGWYEDDLGRIQDDKALIRGMKAFEKKTGAKPYLSLLSDIDPETLDNFAQKQYEALFSGGDHLLVVYDEWKKDTYYLSAQTGEESALTGVDVSLVLSCIEKAYADPANSSYADAFGDGFAQGAKKISSKEGSGSGAGPLLAVGAVLLLLSVGMVVLLRKKARDTGRRTRGNS